MHNRPSPDKARRAAQLARSGAVTLAKRASRCRRPSICPRRRARAHRPWSAPGCAGTSAPTRATLHVVAARACTSSRSSVLTGDFAWHSASRKVVKSCWPTRRCAAACIAVGVERLGDAPGAAALERQARAAIDDAIEIVPLASPRSGRRNRPATARPPAPPPDAAADARSARRAPCRRPTPWRDRGARPGRAHARRHRCGPRRARSRARPQKASTASASTPCTDGPLSCDLPADERRAVIFDRELVAGHDGT